MATKAKKKPSSSASSKKSSASKSPKSPKSPKSLKTPKSPKSGKGKSKGKKKSTSKKAETPNTDEVKAPEITYYEELINTGNPETIKKVNRIKDAFSLFDVTQNETCDEREVGTIIRSLGIYPNEAQLRTLINEMLDEKQPGYVNFNKFLKSIYKIYQNQYFPADDNKLWRVFKVLDPDNKGYLTKEELINFLTTEGEPFTEDELESIKTSYLNNDEERFIYSDYIKDISKLRKKFH
ncbi:EF-hand [Anaeromyces robustus]|uniref:EF-hand n=1 Tax=Anaeromyces robustus TaxID=1754192 RepID=A0A1Y1WYD6_9FUNG|nr:EF-hand [Anaeromyces robustus]|eukprot:ORX78513.1 EF-hand [Anaeromyces robustus]